jgi:hypothetical protein
MMASLSVRCRQWRASWCRFADGFFFATGVAFAGFTAGAEFTAGFGAGACPHAGHASARAASKIVFFMELSLFA